MLVMLSGFHIQTITSVKGIFSSSSCSSFSMLLILFVAVVVVVAIVVVTWPSAALDFILVTCHGPWQFILGTQ